MDTLSYSTPGKWYEDARKEGYSVPLQMMQGITMTMEKRGLNFPDAFLLLEKHEKIILDGRCYIFKLDYLRLFDLLKSIPTKAWAKWASKTTGKPDSEWYGQGMFYLTEVEGLEYEEAEKIMAEIWDK